MKVVMNFDVAWINVTKSLDPFAKISCPKTSYKCYQLKKVEMKNMNN